LVTGWNKPVRNTVKHVRARVIDRAAPDVVHYLPVRSMDGALAWLASASASTQSHKGHEAMRHAETGSARALGCWGNKMGEAGAVSLSLLGQQTRARL
jgi:hypothetical protein